MESADRKDIFVLHATEALPPEEFGRIVMPEEFNIRSINLLRTEPYRADQIAKAASENHRLTVQTGSGLMVLDESTGKINEDPRVKEILSYYLFSLIQFVQGKDIDFLAICFSTQAVCAACNALTNLMQKGIDPHKIKNIHQLLGLFQPTEWEKIWNSAHPMKITRKAEFGILPNKIEQHHSLFDGIEGDEVSGIHINRQAISLKRIKEIQKKLESVLKLTVLTSRTIEVKGEVGMVQILTGLEMQTTLNNTENKPKKPARGVLFQWHPEWGAKPQILTKRLRMALYNPEDGLRHYAPTVEEGESRLKMIEKNTNHGSKVMDNFFRLINLSN
ncbi:MAG: hypothetical protein ACD_28C00282G0002 [uncultured bacterium]|nr:MAG: hypothetical protein ACD_28C00282G0002 [uncultured bacterium]